METPIQSHKYPTDTYAQTDTTHDVQHLKTGEENMLGAVVVGGLIGADCFCAQIATQDN